MSDRENIFVALPWSLLKTAPWEISIGFMESSVALNIRFGHILPVGEDRIKHWTVELIELQSRVLSGEVSSQYMLIVQRQTSIPLVYLCVSLSNAQMLQVSVEDLPCGWTKDNVRLAHKILLRKLTPRALENMCPTTQSLAETIAVIVEETAGAEKFTLDMHVPSWYFTNSDNKVTVSA